MDTHAIGLALIVGGAAFLCSGLIFLLPTGRSSLRLRVQLRKAKKGSPSGPMV
jgi:hypothetical protein